MKPICLSDFVSVPPTHLLPQSVLLEQLARAHAEADGNPDSFQRFRELLAHYGSPPDRISARGSFLPEANRSQWDEMEVYRLHESKKGAELATRMKIFDREVRKIFPHFYPDHQKPADHLIHVTCTGYLSPSAAQAYVSEQKAKTEVSHLYHMGCYASLPATRFGTALVQSGQVGTVDIAHTELCTLHLHPDNHAPEQLVVQSLFADGAIRYRVSAVEGKQMEPATVPRLEVLATSEEQIPNSQDAMTWVPGSSGMSMTLSKEVPKKIAWEVTGFVKRLVKKSEEIWGKERPEIFSKLKSKAIFAIHPGGPRILDGSQTLFRLSDDQVFHSREVLRTRGNMSSATLPHIWKAILEDDSIPVGTPIVSMAFGPGLTMMGSVGVKIA